MTKSNKIVSERTCLLTNKKYDKSQLIRLVKVDNELTIDKSQTMPGRGYWIHYDAEALKNPKTVQILSKRLRTKVTQDLINRLAEYIVNK